MHSASSEAFAKTMAQMKDQAPQLSKIIVEGHTDSRGTVAYNLKLGQGRAETVRKIILQQIPLAPEQVLAKSFGKSQPIALNDTASGRERNRRVEIKIYRK